MHKKWPNIHNLGKLDAGKFLNSGELKKLLPQIMEPGKLTKAGGIVYLPKFKIKNKFDLKDSLSKVSHILDPSDIIKWIHIIQKGFDYKFLSISCQKIHVMNAYRR